MMNDELRKESITLKWLNMFREITSFAYKYGKLPQIGSADEEENRLAEWHAEQVDKYNTDKEFRNTPECRCMNRFIPFELSGKELDNEVFKLYYKYLNAKVYFDTEESLLNLGISTDAMKELIEQQIYNVSILNKVLGVSDEVRKQAGYVIPEEVIDAINDKGER